MLLRIVEAAVERAGGIGNFRERRAARSHSVGAFSRSNGSFGRSALVRAAIRSCRCLARSRSALSTAGQLFSCSALSLSHSCGYARVSECRAVFRAGAPLRPAQPRPLLCVSERAASDCKRGRAGQTIFHMCHLQ
jgi:hypothetical protein